MAVAVHVGRVQLVVAALEEGAHGRGTGGQVHAAPHFHGAQHSGGQNWGARSGLRRQRHSSCGNSSPELSRATRRSECGANHRTGRSAQHDASACALGRLGPRPPVAGEEPQGREEKELGAPPCTLGSFAPPPGTAHQVRGAGAGTAGSPAG